MIEPSDEQIKAAYEATQPYRKLINETPELLSLLYDIDLLPEQIRLYVNAMRMIAICELFKIVPPEALKKAMTDPQS
jgi:hypothetical protein